MLATANGLGNRILDCLNAKESALVLESAQAVSFTQGHVIYEQGDPMPYVYFPTTCVIGVVVVIEEGKQVEGITVGNEGMLGLPVFLGVDFHPYKAVSQIPGEALKVRASTFLQATKPGSTLDRLMRRYALYRMWCSNQTGVCNALHSVEERMCRWLTMAHDGVHKDEFVLTHEFLSELLGVRRQTVSVIAGALNKSGFITYRRGILRVLDRAGLEAASCECYPLMRQLYLRIMQ